MTASKARQLLRAAYATYKQNETEIARDIFVLAMEDPSFAAEFGGEATAEELEAKAQAAIAAGDYKGACGFLQSMEAMRGATAMDEEEEVEEVPPEFLEEDEGEAALSPGGEVPPPPAPELAPAQVASLVTLARRVKDGGHPDLAKRIVKALGL